MLSRNPNYDGPRPSNLDQILYQFNVDPTTSLDQVQNGTADYAAAGLPPNTYAQVAQNFSNQFFVNPVAGLRYIALNTSRSLFSTVAARQAVNFALDRPALIAIGGAFSGSPTDQYIPPTVTGFRDESIYPLNGPSADDLARANALVDQAGIRGQTAILYTGNRQPLVEAAQLIRDQLSRIGINVDIHAFPRPEQIAREGTRGEPFDMTTEGWVNDYNDPFDTLNVFLDGSTIGPSNNNDISYFNDPVYNAQLQAAAQSTGPERYATYGNLDVTLARDQAPLAAIGPQQPRLLLGADGVPDVRAADRMDLATLCIKGARRTSPGAAAARPTAVSGEGPWTRP